jgi:hypothetical protein
MLRSADVTARFGVIDLELSRSKPPAFGRLSAVDVTMWSKVLKAGNITLQ